MKIVYMGTPEFACPPLAALCSSDHEIATVVTGPDKQTGRGRKTVPTPVSVLAEQNGLKVIKPVSLKDDDLFDQLKSLQPDLIVVVAFRILPKRLYGLPKLGAINIHGSLLPKYRGAAPIQWALINGEKQTGLTSFFLKRKVDTGEIISQQKITIEPNDTYDSLSVKMSELAGPFLLETLSIIENKMATPSLQDDQLATPAPKIMPNDCLINFDQPAECVVNFVRGLSSKPGAYTCFRGKKIKVLSASVLETEDSNGFRPGMVIGNRKSLLIQCADKAIKVTTLLPEGKKQMDGSSFMNGFKPTEREQFGEMETTQEQP